MSVDTAEAPPFADGTRDGAERSFALSPALDRTLPVAAGALAFGVYAATLAPTVGFLDSPELSSAAITLGVPHPTGYPLFTLLGHGWQALVGAVVGGDPAWRLNLLTALLAALAVGGIAHVGQRLGGRATSGWLAAGVFGFSPGFWPQANLFEVYSLHVAFTAGMLALWLRFECDVAGGRHPRRALRGLALATGLSLTHHLMTVLVLPVIAVSLVAHHRAWWSPGEALRLGALGLAPLGLYAYLPLAASSDPPVNWGNPETLAALWYHVSGAQFHQHVGSGAVGVLSGGVDAVAALALPVGGALAPLVLLGCVRARPSRSAALALAAGYAAAAAFGITFGVVDSEPFQLNTQLIAALWAGAGGARAVGWLASRSAPAARIAEGILVLVPFALLASTFASADRRQDYTPHDVAVAALAALPEDAVLLTQGPEGYPPVYAQLVEDLRPDVAVVDMYLHVRNSYGPELDRLRRSALPEGVTREMALAHTVASLDGGRRSLWLMPGVPDFAFGEVGLTRIRRGLVDALVRTPPEPRIEVPPRTGVPFDRGFELLGVRADRASVEQGDAVGIELRWRLGDLARTGSELPTVTLVLAAEDGTAPTGRDGLPIVEQKRPLAGGQPLAAVSPGDAIAERTMLLVPRAVPPGTWWLWVSIRDGETWLELPDGRLFTRALRLDVAPRTRPLWTLPGAGGASPPGD